MLDASLNEIHEVGVGTQLNNQRCLTSLMKTLDFKPHTNDSQRQFKTLKPSKEAQMIQWWGYATQPSIFGYSWQT